MGNILLGRITGAHGIRGEVKLKSFAASPADIGKYGPLRTASGRDIVITRMKPAKDEFIAALKGVTDRDQALALKGAELFIPRENLPAAKRGEAYLHDLLGREVVSDGKCLGRIVGFHNFGAGDLMEMDPGGGETLLVPLAFLASLSEQVVVALPEGFLNQEAQPPADGEEG